jgi:hypothetical protein
VRELLTYLTALCLLGFIVIFLLAVHSWDWNKLLCHMVHKQCDWQWRYNEPRYDLAERPRAHWVGLYQCSRCFTWSDGCARWEQRSRQLTEMDLEIGPHD